MKYKGIELKEFTSDTPMVFDPPKKMICWDDKTYTAIPQHVCAFVPNREEGLSAVISKSSHWQHCAEIPEPRRATNRELARWLAQGNGEKKYVDDTEPDDGCFYASNEYTYECACADDSVPEEFLVRKWDDKEWHEPTVDYMGLEE